MTTNRFLTVLCLLILSVINRVHAQDYTAYLRQHQIAFAPDEPLSFSQFDAAFYKNRIFLLGEPHGYATTQTIDLTLLKHLNQRTGLRNYLAEMDFAQADLVNQYLQTGQTALLDSLFYNFRRQTNAGTSQWGNQEFYDKIVAIRTYNQTQPAANHIRFIGVDWFQNKGRYAVALLKHIGNQSLTTPTNRPALDSLRTLLTGDSLSLGKLLPLTASIRRDLAANPAYYRQLLGNNAVPFSLFFELLNCATDKLNRDQVAARMTLFYSEQLHLEQEKLYGLWGYAHILQAGTGKQATFSGLLAKAGQTVITMATMFKDSKMLVHRDHLPFFLRKGNDLLCEVSALNADGKVFKVDHFDDLTSVNNPASVTLFRLDAPDSPYRQTLRLVKTGGLTGTKIEPYSLTPTVTTDYFQYVFLVKDSPAVHLWQPVVR